MLTKREQKFDCPCGYGKNLVLGTNKCPSCGMNLQPLNQLYSLSSDYAFLGENAFNNGELNEAWGYYQTAVNTQILGANPVINKQLIKVLTEKQSFSDALALAKESKVKFQDESADWDKIISDLENRIAEQEKKKREDAEKIEQFDSKKIEIEIKKNKLLKNLAYSGIGIIFTGLLVLGIYLFISADSKKEKYNLTEIAKELKQSFISSPALNKIDIQSDSIIKISGKINASDLSELDICLKKVNVPVKLIGFRDLEVIKNLDSAIVVYNVRKGESLAKIAWSFYGDYDSWNKIYNLNREKIRNPKSLAIGTKLNIQVKNTK